MNEFSYSPHLHLNITLGISLNKHTRINLFKTHFSNRIFCDFWSDAFWVLSFCLTSGYNCWNLTSLGNVDNGEELQMILTHQQYCLNINRKTNLIELCKFNQPTIVGQRQTDSVSIKLWTVCVCGDDTVVCVIQGFPCNSVSAKL